MEESQDSSESNLPFFCSQDTMCKCPIKKIYKERDKVDCPYMASLKTENILVRNPYNGELINARPFFDLLHKHYNDDPNLYAQQIDNEIQIITELIPENEELIEIKNILSQMFDRRDTKRLIAERIIILN